MVAFFHRSHAGTGIDDYTCAFVTKNSRKKSFRICAGQREFIGVTDAGRLEFDQDLAGARTVELDSGDFKGFAGCKRDGCANIHEIVPRALKLKIVFSDTDNSARPQHRTWWGGAGRLYSLRRRMPATAWPLFPVQFGRGGCGVLSIILAKQNRGVTFLRTAAG